MQATPWSRYQQDLSDPNFVEDAAQRLAVEHLQRLYEQLCEQPVQVESWGQRFKNLFGSDKDEREPIKGLYFWGGVGRGKTYLVDTFYDCLPFENKMRMHFHRFMRRIHEEKKQLQNEQDPLEIIADKLAKETRILCFDEFVVNDVADAVILAKLMKGLFARGISLVATSNVEAKDLYKNGLQRSLFLPAIDLIYQHCEVINIDGGVDYRLRFLSKAEIYFSPNGEQAQQGMLANFKHLAVDEGIANAQIEIEGRGLNFKRRADGVIWFNFEQLCDGPRSQNDYIELARCFHTVLLDQVPILDRLKEDQARRFINLIDVFYDHQVKLIIAADTVAEQIYTGTRLQFEFQRTISRLQEMQSHEYLALSHKV